MGLENGLKVINEVQSLVLVRVFSCLGIVYKQCCKFSFCLGVFNLVGVVKDFFFDG